jgi:hypothetical protein
MMERTDTHTTHAYIDIFRQGGHAMHEKRCIYCSSHFVAMPCVQAYVANPPGFFQDGKWGTDARIAGSPVHPRMHVLKSVQSGKHLVHDTVCIGYSDHMVDTQVELFSVGYVRYWDELSREVRHIRENELLKMTIELPHQGIHHTLWPEMRENFSVAYLTNKVGGDWDDLAEVSRWVPGLEEDPFVVEIPAGSACYRAHDACAFHLELLDPEDNLIEKAYRVIFLDTKQPAENTCSA